MGGRLRSVGISWTRLALVAAAVISVYFGFAIVGNRVHQYQLDQQNAQLQQQVKQEQTRNTQLQALKEWMQSDDFIVQMARDQGLALPGDKTILVAAPSTTPQPSDINGWWQRYLTNQP
jgi:cell division protein FtsL